MMRGGESPTPHQITQAVLSINERVAEVLYSSEHTVLSDIISYCAPTSEGFHESQRRPSMGMMEVSRRPSGRDWQGTD